MKTAFVFLGCGTTIGLLLRAGINLDFVTEQQVLISVGVLGLLLVLSVFFRKT